MQLVRANAAAVLSGSNQLPGTVNYFVGRDPNKWLAGVPTFAQVKYAAVYPGVDLVYYGGHGRLEFDFELAPEADPEAIQLRFDGSRNVRLDHNGNLIVVVPSGEISFQKPVIYQLVGEYRKLPVEGSFRIASRNTVRFALGPYDHARPLIIDPILNYSLDISAGSSAKAIAVDAAGEAYVTGLATSAFPITAGSFQTKAATSQLNGPYVAKFNSTGTALLYSTYLSGSGGDTPLGIALDANGDAFVVGWTNSKDFPTTAGAFQTVNKAATETAFVTALNSTGTALLYSTYLGGSTGSAATGIAIDTVGNAYIAGGTSDTDFPTTSGAFQTVAPVKTVADTGSAFVSKLNPAGSALLYSSYLSGNGSDAAAAISVDSSGDAYVAGWTGSFNFPTTHGAFQLTNKTLAGRSTGFVTKVNGSGSGLLYSTYLGGSSLDVASALAVDTSGDAYVTGFTLSTDFPVTPGVVQPSLGKFENFTAQNSFVTKLNPAGSGLVYSTYLGGTTSGAGGSSEDFGYGIGVDSQGNAVVVGTTSGIDFPTTIGAFETENLAELNSGGSATFLTKINPTASSFLYSTYLCGTGDQDGDGDLSIGLALDPAGNAYIAGLTVSADFPTTLGVVQTPFGFEETYVTEFNASEMETLPATTVSLTSSPSPVVFGHRSRSRRPLTQPRGARQREPWDSALLE